MGGERNSHTEKVFLFLPFFSAAIFEPVGEGLKPTEKSCLLCNCGKLGNRECRPNEEWTQPRIRTI